MVTSPQVEPMIEEHQVRGEKLLARARELIHEGNVRRLIVKNDDGAIILEVPLTVGVVGAVLLPVWVALGAIAALAADFRIAVEQEPRAVPQEPHFHCRADV